MRQFMHRTSAKALFLDVTKNKHKMISADHQIVGSFFSYLHGFSCPAKPNELKCAIMDGR